MKCSLGISNFLEEISSLSHSVVFLYFLALIAEEGFLISSCYSLELCILWIKGSGSQLQEILSHRTFDSVLKHFCHKLGKDAPGI